MKTKLIFNSFIAKQLLIKYQHPIIDLLKDYKRENGVIFVFEENERFKNDLTTLSIKEI